MGFQDCHRQKRFTTQTIGIAVAAFDQDNHTTTNSPRRTFKSALPAPIGYESLHVPRSQSGAAIGAARRRLIYLMGNAYWLHAAGAVLYKEPQLGSFKANGQAIVNAAAQIEANILFEWQVLDNLEQIAQQQLLPLEQLGNNSFIPSLQQHTTRIVGQAPLLAANAAQKLAQQYGAEGSIFPQPQVTGSGPVLGLPLAPEKPLPFANIGRSQLVRASTPWVQYWRQPIACASGAACCLFVAISRGIIATPPNSTQPSSRPPIPGFWFVFIHAARSRRSGSRQRKRALDSGGEQSPGR